MVEDHFNGRYDELFKDVYPDVDAVAGYRPYEDTTGGALHYNATHEERRANIQRMEAKREIILTALKNPTSRSEPARDAKKRVRWWTGQIEKDKRIQLAKIIKEDREQEQIRQTQYERIYMNRRTDVRAKCTTAVAAESQPPDLDLKTAIDRCNSTMQKILDAIRDQPRKSTVDAWATPAKKRRSDTHCQTAVAASAHAASETASAYAASATATEDASQPATAVAASEDRLLTTADEELRDAVDRQILLACSETTRVGRYANE